MIMLYTFVKQNNERPVRQFVGVPLGVFDDETEPRPFNPATLLVIAENSSDIFLFRFDQQKNMAGDTWHQSIEDAKYQAQFEFGEDALDWSLVPSEFQDAVVFAKSMLAEEPEI